MPSVGGLWNTRPVPWFRRRPEVVVVQEAGTGNIDLILDEARRTEDALHQLHSAMDQRAGVLLGFSGVLVTVGVTSGAGERVPVLALLLALVLVASAAAASAWPLITHPMQTINPGALAEGYADTDRATTVTVVTSQIAWIVDQSERRLRRKTVAVRVAALLLVGSVLTVTVGTILEGWPQVVSATDATASPAGGEQG